MILSFGDNQTEELFVSETSRRFSSISRIALRKLIQLHSADYLRDLAVPPGNRLEEPRGDRGGFHSIRVNDQWRIVFRWTPFGPEEVSIVDYH